MYAGALLTLPEDIIKGEMRMMNLNLNNELTSWRAFPFHWPSDPVLLAPLPGLNRIS